MMRQWILKSAIWFGIVGLGLIGLNGCENTGQAVIDTTIKPVSATIDGLGQMIFPTRYEPNWESLDTRKTPEWFSDAKFGIFIHWGVYSVPAWGPKGTYAEWYWRNAFKDDGKTLKDDAWGQYHKQTYGENFPYADFAPQFTCEKYNPDEWADLFEKAGAKYIVLTSKHHEGFTLWPNAEASKTWGRPWNAVEVGPKRDILGDLTRSVRDRGIKMGYYYSLYEWFNPLWLSDRKKYVAEHMLPQVKDLVKRYKPDILWGDGEWDMADKDWGSEELMAWLFNESPVRNTIAINDRWGKDVRHKHGGYYTTEYGAGLKDASHPWEECRGMGHSFGYNSNEGPEDYKSVRELLLILIDLTSRGGCLLLDIGPTKEGQIPQIMQERLLGMGEWLLINGEAIYGTRMYKTSCQWSEGKQPEQEYKDYKVKYNVLDVVGQPKDGKAVKQAFFTAKPNTLYAILPVWPGKEFILRDVNPDSGVKVSLLGRDGNLPWKKIEGGMAIDLSSIDEKQLPGSVAWTLKIKGKL
ncbi:MAG: alpha-L-fucosidase [Phycisphaerae bacterium]|nr:alpha-L-fucosidase [Phycisphaerae bacterium]